MTTHRGGTAAPPLTRRLTALRGGPEVPPRPMDARALAALAANPGCHRRALMDGAGVDKGAVAERLGAPASFGQSQFAFVRGNAFEARVRAEGGAALVRLLCGRTGQEPPESGAVAVPDLAADGPVGRAARTRLALAEATATGGWTLLEHPLLTLTVADAPVYLEPDALAVGPDGVWTVVEIKSFPILDGSADPAKVGAAARQAAVYALALEEPAAAVGASVRQEALLVCPRDFSNLPTAAALDLRKPAAATRRQLARLRRVGEIADAVPEGVTFDPAQPPAALAAAVASVPAQYAPECLSGCELAFHCRSTARAAGSVEALGRSVRGELGGLSTIGDVLTAASFPSLRWGDPTAPGAPGSAADPAAAALRRAARLRAEALAAATGSRPRPAAGPPGPGPAGAGSDGTASPGTASSGTAPPAPGGRAVAAADPEGTALAAGTAGAGPAGPGSRAPDVSPGGKAGAGQEARTCR